MTLTVHHLGVSQSSRIVWLCEELEIPYELVVHKRAPVFSPQSLKDLHPLGAAPVVQDGDVLLAESAACAEYIIHKHGGGRLALPPSDPDYATYLFWFHFANGTLHPGISRMMSVMDNPEGDSFKWMRAKLDGYLAYLDRGLEGKKWLVGDRFTAADVMCAYSASFGRSFYPYELQSYPNILAWVKRCVEREGHKRFIQKAEPELELDLLIGPEAPKRFTGLGLEKWDSSSK